MKTLERWQQAMRPHEGDVLCMDDVEVYSQWVSEIHDDKCPFCGQQLVSRKAIDRPVLSNHSNHRHLHKQKKTLITFVISVYFNIKWAGWGSGPRYTTRFQFV